MCRRTRTVLQRSRLGRFLPLNMATFAHKVVGYVTGICILGHCILHMLHFCTLYISIQHYFEILDLFSLYIIMIRVSFKDFAGCWHELDLIATSVYYHSGNRLLLIIKYVVIDTLRIRTFDSFVHVTATDRNRLDSRWCGTSFRMALTGSLRCDLFDLSGGGSTLYTLRGTVRWFYCPFSTPFLHNDNDNHMYFHRGFLSCLDLLFHASSVHSTAAVVAATQFSFLHVSVRAGLIVPGGEI